MLIETDGERFSVRVRVQDDGCEVYDFLWINGPSGYGFTLGKTAVPGAAQTGFSRAELESEASLFVRAFFSPEGIGPSDFPEFVSSRREDRSRDRD